MMNPKRRAHAGDTHRGDHYCGIPREHGAARYLAFKNTPPAIQSYGLQRQKAVTHALQKFAGRWPAERQ